MSNDKSNEPNASAPAKPNVAICIPCGSDHQSIYFKWSLEGVVSKMPPSRLTTHKLELHDSHSVDSARRKLTQSALDIEGLTHVFFVDDDMCNYAPDSILRLLDKMEANPHADIIGGLCFNRRNPYMPTIAREQPSALGLEDHAMGWVYDYPPDTLYECDRTGAAFLLIKAEVLRKLVAAHGIEHVWESTPTEGEDISFCRKVRALGYRIFVDTGCRVGHIGQVVVDEAFAKRNRSHLWQPWCGEYAAPSDHVGESEQPLVSVVIPTFNQEKRKLNGAVQSALAQTVRQIEVIVVDDGSATPVAPFHDPRVRVIRHEVNKGVAAALNTGINAMRAEWFCWLSSDDLFYPQKIERQLTFLKQREGVASYHHYDSLGPDTDPLKSYPIRAPLFANQLEQRKMIVEGCWINGSTVMLHKSVLERARLGDGSYFDPSYRYSQDWDFWCRITQIAYWHLLDEVQGARRNNGGLTQEVLEDREKDRLWKREDARIKDKYALKRCECCGQWRE